MSVVGSTGARPAHGLAVDFVVEFDRAQLNEVVQRVRDGRLRTNIGNVATLDDAVAAFNPTERRKGKTIIRVRPGGLGGSDWFCPPRGSASAAWPGRAMRTSRRASPKGAATSGVPEGSSWPTAAAIVGATGSMGRPAKGGCDGRHDEPSHPLRHSQRSRSALHSAGHSSCGARGPSLFAPPATGSQQRTRTARGRYIAWRTIFAAPVANTLARVRLIRGQRAGRCPKVLATCWTRASVKVERDADV